MALAEIYDSDLQKERSEKIKSLGFLCYNLYIDGAIAFPEMSGMIEVIRGSIESLMQLRRQEINVAGSKLQEINLDEKLSELGFFCYSLYIDRRIFNNELLEICREIEELSHNIENSAAVPVANDNAPFEMEPVPENFKRCACGYKNRPIAKFCGRCGAAFEA